MVHQHVCEQATLHHTQKSQARRPAMTQACSASHRMAPANSMHICDAASCQCFMALLRVLRSTPYMTAARRGDVRMETFLSYASRAAINSDPSTEFSRCPLLFSRFSRILAPGPVFGWMTMQPGLHTVSSSSGVPVPIYVYTAIIW